MDLRETGQDTKLIVGQREFGVSNVEEAPGETELAEAESNMQLENATAPAGVSHTVTITVDGSAREVDEACYDENWHPRTDLRIQTRGSESGTEYTRAKPTSRSRSVPSKDGTETEIEVRADKAIRTSGT